jgi:aminoacrylate hydrolase
VVGESFGGMISQELATRHPERVAALVLCNTMARAHGDHLGANWFTAASLLHPLAFALPRRLQLPYLDWIGKHRGFVMDPSPGNRDLSGYILEHGLDPGWCYLNRYRAGLRADYRPLLPSIAAPTLILHGEEDRVVGERTIAELAGLIPGAAVARIEGGGHCCQYTRPEATNRALLDWLADHYPAGE